MEYLALALIVIALVLLWISARRQTQAGLPGGRVIYTDMRGWGPVEKPLYDQELGLAGKPDYLVEKGGIIIPVEVKSTRVVDAPYDSHIYQLAAYCLLVQRTLGTRPPYGILRYSNRTFAIDYTPQLETALIELLNEMRLAGERKEQARSHDNPERCARCGYRSNCDQALH
jgi:CRISPR-associated exonuclease Cas4